MYLNPNLSTLQSVGAKIVAHLVIVGLFLNPILASAETLPITPDGSTNTQITKTASGIDQLNIAAPNSSGLSHNKFSDYNVNQSGQVINNFSGQNAAGGSGVNAVVNTQIGGLVTANPNLVNSGSARVILNEVTSSNVSRLLGYTEIAGAKADLILANPNGIACRGCGFINTAKLLMVAGNSNFDTNGNLGFNLKEQANPNLYVPLITIDGLGLDVTNASATDIIASSVKLLSSIYASDDSALTIKTGEGRYDYNSKDIAGANSQNNSQNNNPALFAIDASSLAKIQAGQIYLIATKQGVGVNMEAEILASSTVNIDANGDVYYSSIAAGQTVNLKSSATIQSVDSSSQILVPSLNIEANQFKNLGLASANSLNIQNSAILNNLGNIEALDLNLTNINNINNLGSIYAQNSLNISGINLTNSLSQSYSADSSLAGIFSPQSYVINLSGLLTNSGSISSANDLTINSSQLNNSSQIFAEKNLNFNLSDSLINSGEISALNNLSITGTSVIDNSNSILSNSELSISGVSLYNQSNSIIASLNKSLTITLSADLENNGELNSLTDLTISAANFVNSGNILSSSNLILNTSGLNNSGNLQSTQDTSINSLSLNNSGLIKAFGKATINSDIFSNSATIYLAGDLTILSNSDLSNSGTIYSSGSLEITAANISNNNSAWIFSGRNASLNSSNNFTNAGNLQATTDLTLSIGGSADNSGTILGNQINSTGSQSFNNSGVIGTDTNFVLSSGIINNSGLVLSGNNLTFTAQSSITNSGNLQSDNDSILNAATLDNSGSIKAFNNATINISSITNQANALIFSDSDLLIMASNSLINQGSILSNSKLDVSAASITNNNEIFANSDLTLTLSNFLNNSGSISSLAKAEISSAAAVTNSGQIISGSNLSVSATNLANSNLIQSNSALTLNLASLTNSKNIIADTTFDIAASGTIANAANSAMQSGDKFTISAASFDNASAALILSGKDLLITAASITNQNTKPTASIITSGLVSADGTITLKTDSLNNNSGIIAAKSTTLNSLNATSVNLSNDLGAFISTAAIILNLGNLDYTITGTFTASNIDITANNINNQGNVTASDYIKLNATGASGAGGSGNITNGFSSGDNSNIQLAAGTYINFTAKNNIINYATISANTDLTMTATNGQINNYKSIISGNGEAVINAALGGFTNFTSSSVLTSNNNIIFNTKDLTNSGEISVAGDLIANITNNLANNSSALIWSGNDATFNVSNNFTNDRADIYANNNLTIQKNTSSNSSLNKTTLVQNISGNIETYEGDIVINATSFENKRSADVVTKVIGVPNTRDGTNMTGWRHYRQYCSGNNCENWTHFFSAASLSNNTVSAKLSAGKNLTISSDSFKNDTSEISSVNNMNISFKTSFVNNSVSSLVGDFTYRFIDAWDRDYHEYYDNKIGRIDGLIYNYIVNFPAYIKAGGSLNIAQNGTTNSSFINGTNVAQYAPVGNVSLQSQSTTLNQINIYNLGETGALNIDLSAISSLIAQNNNSAISPDSSITNQVNGNNNPLENIDDSQVIASDAAINPTAPNPTNPQIIFSGNFKINLDPAATTPLIESRSQFTKVSEFFGSEYYFNALGLNGKKIIADIDRQTRNTNLTRSLGDAFVETKLITDQIKSLTNDSLLLSKTTTDTNAQIKELLDNSIAELNRLGLNATDVAMKGLSKDQANSLTKDIVTFETTKVNGINVLAPKIYLSLDTRSRLLGSDSAIASNSTIFAKDDLTINAPTANLLNSGSIIAGNNLSMNLGNLSSITSDSGNLGSTSISAIAKIKAGNDLTITANNINATTPEISSVILPTISNKLSTVRPITATLSTANLSANSTASGITLQNTLISAGNKTSLTSEGDITIKNDKNLKLTTLSAAIPSIATSAADTSSDLISSSSTTKDDAIAARSALTFNSGSDIEITSASNINIDNHYTNAGGSIFMTATNNINNSNYTIYASDNVVMEANNINNIHSLAPSGYSATGSLNDTRIEAGNIVSLNAIKDTEGNGGNINNIGATIKAGTLAYLTAENNINNKALVEYNINGQTSYSSGLTNTQTATDFTNTTLDNSGTSASDTNLLNSNANYIRSNLIAQGNISAGDSATNTAGNLVLVAGNNLNNIGSNIAATGSTYLEATNGDINITTAQLRDRTVSRWGGRKRGGVSVSDNTTNIASNITSGTLGTGTLELLATSNSSAGSSTSGNINITGSSLSSADNLTLTAQNDINIKSAQDTTYNFSAGRLGKGKSYLNQLSSNTQIASNLNTTNNGDISITSGINNTDTIGSSSAKGNLSIIASKLTTADSDNNSANNVGSGDVSLVARNNLNISSALNTKYSESFSSKKGTTVKKTSTEIDETRSNVSSEISASGDLTTTSGGDTNIIASKLSADGSGSLTAGKYLDYDSSSSTYNQEVFNSDAKVNILSGLDTKYHYLQTTKVKTSIDPNNPLTIVLIAGAVFTGGATLALAAAASSVEVNKTKNTSESYSEKVVASELNFGKDLTISSASDLNIAGSKLSAGINPITKLSSGNQGDLSLIAGLISTTNYNTNETTLNTNSDAKINISSASQRSYSSNVSENSGIGGENIKLKNDELVIGSATRNQSRNIAKQEISSEINSNNGDINIISQKDLNIVASNINAVADQSGSGLGNINLLSNQGNVNIFSAYDTNYSSSETFKVDGGLRFEINSHEIALKLGAKGGGTKNDEKSGTVISSNIMGSAINISSGLSSDYGSGLSDAANNKDLGNVNINSANLVSSEGSTSLVAANDINLTTSSNFYEQTSSSYDFDANVRLGISYNFKDNWKSIEALKDVKLENAAKYLAVSSVAGYMGAGAASTYVATYGPAISSMMEGDSFDESLAKNGDYMNDANTINNAGKGGSGSAGLTVELAYSEQKSGFKQTDVISNNIISNSDISLTSANSDLNIRSSNLSANNDITLNATKGNINILADTSNSDSFSRSFDLTGSIALIGKGGGLNFSMSKSKSAAETYINSNLTALGDFNLNSGQDTNIISSNIFANNINMVVAGDLNLESRQNTSESKAISFGIGGGFVKSGSGKSANGNLSYSKSVSDRDWVDNQASIIGSNSVTINVGNNTNLVGSVIANSTNGKTSNDGIDGGNLTLNTKSLTFANLYDSDEARSFGIGIGGGVRWGAGSSAKGSGSLTLDYSMHDFKQTTNATIGQGIINIGTTLNLDGNNNLISVTDGEAYNGSLNRNIQLAQVTTKHLEVEPIHIKETFEFGRNSTESQKKASSNNSGSSSSSSDRPTIWQDLAKDRSSQSTLGATASFISDVGSGLFANLKITLSDFATQINPLRGFSNSLDGISSDLRNMRNELGIETKTLNVGQDRKFINIDGKGNQIGSAFTFEEYLKDPTLAANKLFSNGVMNNFNDAQKNALTQLGSADQNGRITILFDPSAAPDVSFSEAKIANTKGFFSDLAEVSINYLGANILGGAIQTKGQSTDQKFINAVTDNAKQNGETITLAGHSGGGLRNYSVLANSSPNQYLDSNGNSVLQVQFSGTPVNNFDLNQATNNSGAKFLKTQNNFGDTVGNILGSNGTIIDAISSVGGGLFLFSSISPHSNYGCKGYWCNAKGDLNFDLKQFTKTPSLINNNSDSSPW